MFWLKCVTVCTVLLRVHCYIPYYGNRCTEEPADVYIYPNYGDGDQPKPPEIGHSYIAKYEMNTIDANHPAWVEEYFDYEGKRAKISASVLGVEFVDIYDYGRGTVTSYRLSRRALPFSYPSGEERVPLYIEMRGPDLNNNAKEIYTMMYVSWFQKDPEFSFDTFQVPKGLHCDYSPNRGRLPSMPSSFSYGVEETVFQLDGSGFLKGGFASLSYKKVWYDSELKLARIDMRPSKEDLKSELRSVGDSPGFISVIFDLKTGFTYVGSVAESKCLLVDKQKTHFWKHPNGSLKTSDEFFGISANLQYKGKATIMGAEAMTWTEVVKGAGKSSTIKRDMSFASYDTRKDTYSNKHVFSLIQEAIYEEEDTQQNRSGEFPNQNVIIRNYLYFNSFAPEQDVFSPHACLPEKPAGSYYINFKPLKACTLDAANRTRFLAAFRNALRISTKLSTILAVQNFHFRWYNGNGTSVGFTFHEDIPGEKSTESKFSTIAKQKAEGDQKPLTVSFRLTAASEMNECTWQSYLFHKQRLTVLQPTTTPSPGMAV
ncbi:uncharacterized protein [Dermacentor andersoni]|uniref:uncharacterized protein isoform X4 n=1 Tax=Dermacentor andersoni TaxID=34620 RepID=UPI0024166C71|nr:uncharacterized protein LOC126530910 isoform X4 [Dermacentor andersoni]